jgi:hypothetical protein
MYHDVRDFSDTRYPKRYELKSFLTRKEFEFQIDYICTNYTVIRSDEVLGLNIDGDGNYAVLTFDDGLADHYYVAQYLKSKGVSGTFLIPRTPIVDHKMIHSHKLQFVQAEMGEASLKEEILNQFEDPDLIWDKYSQTKWKGNWWSKDMIFCTNFLRNYKSDDINCYDLTDQLLEQCFDINEEEFAKDLYLTVKQIEEMANMGHVIGGHGDVSENLLLLDNMISYSDIEDSLEFIKPFADTLVFSYPNGGFHNGHKDALKHYGCEIAFTVNPMTITNLDTIDYLEFPRYDGPQKLPLE